MDSAPPDLQIWRQAWNARAARELAGTYHAPEAEEFFCTGVASGRMQLWRVSEHSWAVTEVIGGRVFVWAYAGRALAVWVRGLVSVCRLCGVPEIRFYTRRRGLARLLREFAPERIGDGFYRIRV